MKTEQFIESNRTLYPQSEELNKQITAVTAI